MPNNKLNDGESFFFMSLLDSSVFSSPGLCLQSNQFVNEGRGRDVEKNWRNGYLL